MLLKRRSFRAEVLPYEGSYITNEIRVKAPEYCREHSGAFLRTSAHSYAPRAIGPGVGDSLRQNDYVYQSFFGIHRNT